jgi:hypothetical protein
MSQRVGAKRRPMINSAKFETGEGSVSAGSVLAETDPSSVTDFVRATFSHKGRREVSAPSHFAPSFAAGASLAAAAGASTFFF